MSTEEMLIIKGMISELNERQKKIYDETYALFRSALDKHEEEEDKAGAVIALAMIGMEMQDD